MSPIDQHLQKLLGEQWTHYTYQCRPHFSTNGYDIEARDDDLMLRHRGFLLASEELPRFADIHRVHKALEKLFDAFPKYMGAPPKTARQDILACPTKYIMLAGKEPAVWSLDNSTHFRLFSDGRITCSYGGWNGQIIFDSNGDITGVNVQHPDDETGMAVWRMCHGKNYYKLTNTRVVDRGYHDFVLAGEP
jgi:hypothetical protein